MTETGENKTWFYLNAFNDALPSDTIIDEFGIWDRILTQSERNYLYNNGKGRKLFR